MSEELGRKVDKLAEDQVSLTRNVDRVTLLFEQSEKDRLEDKTLIKEIGQVIKTLDKKLDGVEGLQKEVAQCKEDIRINSHDIRDMKSGVAHIADIDKKLTTLEAEYRADKNIHTGRTQVVTFMGKVFYGFVTLGGFSLLYAVLHFFFGVNVHMTRNPDPIIPVEQSQYEEGQLDNPDKE